MLNGSTRTEILFYLVFNPPENVDTLSPNVKFLSIKSTHCILDLC